MTLLDVALCLSGLALTLHAVPGIIAEVRKR